MSGHVYRIAKADADRLKEIVRDVVSFPCWTFGGASVWDFDTGLGDKRFNLRPITQIDPNKALDVRGDFGHAFSTEAEVRWKRIGQDSYDVLILSETARIIQGAYEIQPERLDNAQGKLIKDTWRANEPGENAAIIQTDNRPAISYVTYSTPQGTVQFMRYKEAPE
ncbi:MAG: hypothetical protein MI924_33465 [Chloroflexales bacterium]|nr:hypothetical protein [Chloroflexales bacterium]